MRVAIIGGGPAGCAAAYTLQKNKIDFEIIEPKKRKIVKKSYADNFLN